jgi:hypothetical protein
MTKYKIEIKWAVIFIAAILVWMIFEKLVGLHTTHIDKHALYTNFFAIPAIVIYVFALLDKRNNYFNGFISWKDGFITGLIITLIITVLTPLTQIIISNIITPEYFPNIIEYSVKEGMMTLEEAEKYFSLSSYIMQGAIGSFIMGIITSAIVALFIRKKSKDTSEN